MEHYICTGSCEGVAQTPGTCQSQSCPKHEHPLERCDCEDGKHNGAFEKPSTDQQLDDDTSE